MVDFTLKTIRLNLARTPEFPDGSERHFYCFTAPLDGNGHLNAEGWRRNRERCRVVRSWAGEEEDIGHLVHRPAVRGGFIMTSTATRVTRPATGSAGTPSCRVNMFRSVTTRAICTPSASSPSSTSDGDEFCVTEGYPDRSRRGLFDAVADAACHRHRVRRPQYLRRET